MLFPNEAAATLAVCRVLFDQLSAECSGVHFCASTAILDLFLCFVEGFFFLQSLEKFREPRELPQRLSAQVRWLLHLFLLFSCILAPELCCGWILIPLVKNLALLLIFYISHFGFVCS